MDKVPSLKILNNIAQKPDYKRKGNWMARNITRDMALPVTWLALHFPISANFITLLSLITGISACLFFSFGSKISILIGSVMLQIWYLLDHVDGQVARYRKEESVTGVFFDYIAHHLIHIGIFIGIAWALYAGTADKAYLLFGTGAAAGILILNLTADSRYKAFYYWINKKYSCGENNKL